MSDPTWQDRHNPGLKEVSENRIPDNNRNEGDNTA